MISTRWIAASVAFFLATGMAGAQNTVDAVGSASAEIRISGGTAWADSAVLISYHKDSYSHHWLAWGLTWAFGDTVISADTPRTVNIVLRDLSPATTYHFKYVGDNPLNDSIETHSISGSFTTAALTDIRVPRGSFHRNASPFLLVGNRFVVDREVQTGDVMLFRDMQGRIVFAALVNAGAGNSIEKPSLARGQYTVQLMRNGTTLLKAAIALL